MTTAPTLTALPTTACAGPMRCPHCVELALVSPGLAAAYRWPEPHSKRSFELVEAARDVERRRTCKP